MGASETRSAFAAVMLRQAPFDIGGNAGVQPPAAAFQQIYEPTRLGHGSTDSENTPQSIARIRNTT
jgi:hypothetical protein